MLCRLVAKVLSGSGAADALDLAEDAAEEPAEVERSKPVYGQRRQRLFSVDEDSWMLKCHFRWAGKLLCHPPAADSSSVHKTQWLHEHGLPSLRRY